MISYINEWEDALGQIDRMKPSQLEQLAEKARDEGTSAIGSKICDAMKTTPDRLFANTMLSDYGFSDLYIIADFHDPTLNDLSDDFYDALYEGRREAATGLFRTIKEHGISPTLVAFIKDHECDSLVYGHEENDPNRPGDKFGRWLYDFCCSMCGSYINVCTCMADHLCAPEEPYCDDLDDNN